MMQSIPKFSVFRSLSLSLLLLFTSAVTIAEANECKASSGYGFVCGPQNAEDLVLVPATKWIISSAMAPGAEIYLIDSNEKSWTNLYPADAPLARQDMATYGSCPGSPDPNNFVTHGLNIRPGENGHSTLYVVGHGGREAIEVFDVNANGVRPTLTWTGCVLMPEGMAANSVASLNDGSLLVTVPLHPGKTIADAFKGELTGAIYAWSPGDNGFKIVEGTELPYANGIEVSADGQEIYVVSSVLNTLLAYSHSNPSRQLRSSSPLAFIPDNLHWTSDGSLITAGMIVNFPRCDKLQTPGEFDLAKFAACPRPFIVSTIDPNSMQIRNLVAGPDHESFSNATMALVVGNDVWVGTFSGDRIGYLPLK